MLKEFLNQWGGILINTIREVKPSEKECCAYLIAELESFRKELDNNINIKVKELEELK